MSINNTIEPIISIIGPTACGKTKRAVELSQSINAEIISGDSRQVYVGMDLGTGKDIEEYGDIPVHLIDIRPAGYKYNLHEFLIDYYVASEDIRRRNKNIVLCGGTGLYIESVLSGIHLPKVPENPQLRSTLQNKTIEELEAILKEYKTLHNQTDLDTCKRAIRAIEIQEYYRNNPQLHSDSLRQSAIRPLSIIIGLDIPRDIRREKITKRLKARIDAGMIDEVRKLIDSGVKPNDLIYYGLEYKYLTQFVIGKLSFDEMYSQLEIAIHQFAKRQMTWFRGMERRGFKINWLPYNLSTEEFIKEANNLIHK